MRLDLTDVLFVCAALLWVICIKALTVAMVLHL